MPQHNPLPSFAIRPSSNIEYRLSKAIEACQGAGALIKEIRDNGLCHSAKGVMDTVTQADLASERFIQNYLAECFPADTFFGEESLQEFSSQRVWVIDPIDGTVNFASGSHYWCISLAWVEQDCCKLGVIYAPDLEQMFVAVEGCGSYCNNEPLQIQSLEQDQQALIGVGTSNRTAFSDYIKVLALLQHHGYEHRRYGSGALMLAEVAAGSLQAYFEAHMNSWDALAGLLLVQEAGGCSQEFITSTTSIQDGNRVFATAKSQVESLSSIFAEIA